MKALSIKPEWAWLICCGMPFRSSNNQIKIVKKDIENRSCKTSYRGRVYIHASKRNDKNSQEWLMKLGLPIFVVLMLYSDKIPRGEIIGEVDIIDCVTESKSPWFTGPYGWVLNNSILYDKPIPYKGRLGFFEVPDNLRQDL